MASSSPTTERTDTVKTILVVDDDPLIGKAMRTVLGKAGFRAFVYATAAQGLAHADSSIAAAIVDIHLPDMNGLELSQRLRERLGPDAPIFILSGDRSIDTIRQLPDAGATYFFAKPVNADVLIERLTEWTSGR